VFANVSHTILRPVLFYGVRVCYVAAGSRDRTHIRGALRASVLGLVFVTVFVLNAGIPPGILSGAELWILYGVRADILPLIFVRFSIFVGGL